MDSDIEQKGELITIATVDDFKNLILAIQNQQSAYMIALRLLDNEPIAYDIRKVIEELEKAIEIIKQSDVSDDVCEYRITDKMVYASCNNKQIASAFCWFNECGDYSYCPYCGKKIKVV